MAMKKYKVHFEMRMGSFKDQGDLEVVAKTAVDAQKTLEDTAASVHGILVSGCLWSIKHGASLKVLSVTPNK